MLPEGCLWPVHGPRSTGELTRWKKLVWMSRRGGGLVGSNGRVNGFGSDALGRLPAGLGRRRFGADRRYLRRRKWRRPRS